VGSIEGVGGVIKGFWKISFVFYRKGKGDSI